MDYKKVGVVSSVVLAYSGFTASIPVQATTVSTDSFTLQDDRGEKPVDLTIKQLSTQSSSEITEESTSRDTMSEITETNESTQTSISDSESSSDATSESLTSSEVESTSTDSINTTDTTSSSSQPSVTTDSSEQKTGNTSHSQESSKIKESTKETEKKEASVKIPAIIFYSPNYSTQRFVSQIAEQARTISQEHDLYASVMIAQSILESGSGNSGLASPPNYNLFGIKGSYGGQTVRFATSEDDGSGKLNKINANFKKYSSYKESLEDYANLLSRNLYSGARKSNTSSYQEATSFLTGRYATDTSYGAKLNGLIEAYNLAQYDNPVEKTTDLTEVKDSSSTIVKPKVEADKAKEASKMTVEQNFFMHEVQFGESLKKISELYETPISTIVQQNQLNRLVLMVGQVLKIETSIRPNEVDQTIIESDTRLKQDILLNKKITEVIPEPVFKTKDLRYKITATSALPTDSYQVQRGDSLLKISQKVGLSVQSIREWNQLEGYLLREGQILRITPTLSV